ncbi:DUF4278 domain-containing protein [Oscillatoria sp. FACHB-1407]|uniref:DUF4278 domain-containing protein n=1 Tax=Oscillatoria sp. FACHB-1407 TaxID=2692847 RepID=UPI001682ED56|nr:DUF4278 domain-containing protein [Oscillatoria sp. FACHB-1407]MBD2460288.1 DUF4278 domain-containing protein [Oscillatoria sp. FACHB-1407]
MQLMSSIFPRPNSAKNISTDSSTTHTLIYRGAIYQIPQQRVKRATRVQEQFAQRVEKQLVYRGAAYEIAPASIPEAIAPTTIHRLIYRGATYLKAI